MKHIALFALLMMLFAPAAKAALDTDARAQVLKGQIEGFLENQKAMAMKNGCKLVSKGSVTMEKTADYYAYTLPHLTYTDSRGVRSEIGMIAVNAVPQGEFEWKVSLAVPTPISSFGPSGAEQFRTDIGTQSASGVWNEKLGHFTSLSAKLANVQLNDLEDQNTATVGALNFDSNLQEQDPEAYTGSAIATLANISFFDAATSYKGAIPQIKLTTNLADRASKTPMTKEQVQNRQQSAQPDAYNVFSFLFGAPERVTGIVTGLDGMTADLQQSMLTAPPANRAKMLQAMLGIGAISAMGKPVAGNPNSKSYDIVFGANGSVLINGTDFGSLMSNGTAPAAGATTGTIAPR